MNLLEETKHLLINRPNSLTFKELGRECGVSPHWLSQLSLGKVENPGFATLERVNAALKQRLAVVNV